MGIFGQTCNAFLPQYNSETVGLLTTRFGMVLGNHLKKQAHVMRPRPNASVAALAPLERRGGCGNFFCVTLFCPTTTIVPLGCGTSERNGLARKDVKNLPQAFPLPGHQSVTHLRGAKGGYFGGAAVRKRKVLVLNDQFRPKRPKNGFYQGHTARTSVGNSASEAFRNPGSPPRPCAHLFTKTLFIPFV